MRRLTRWSGAGLAALSLLGACSVLNKFDDIEDVAATGGASGDGDETSGDGDTSIGGKGGGSNTGDGDETSGDGDETSGDGDGTGGGPVIEPLEPGLVLVNDDADGNLVTVDDRALVALDPRTGEELTRIPGDFFSAVYEADRDLWFLVKALDASTQELSAAQFNRTTREFEPRGKKLVIPKGVERGLVFALTGKIGVVTLEATIPYLHLFDTKDLENLKQEGAAIPWRLDSAAYPGPEKFWSAVAAPSANGGSIFELLLGCMADEAPNCSPLIRRITHEGVVTVSGPVGANRIEVDSPPGLIAHEPASPSVVVFFVDTAMGPNPGQLLTATPNGTSSDGVFRIAPAGVNSAHLEVDPCTQVAFLKDTTPTAVAAAGYFGDPGDVSRKQTNFSAGSSGQGMAFEPYTKSLILIQPGTGDNAGITAWTSGGDSLVPQMKQRFGSWDAPVLHPTFVRVESPLEPLCDQ